MLPKQTNRQYVLHQLYLAGLWLRERVMKKSVNSTDLCKSQTSSFSILSFSFMMLLYKLMSVMAYFNLRTVLCVSFR